MGISDPNFDITELMKTVILLIGFDVIQEQTDLIYNLFMITKWPSFEPCNR
jgi:hypothetical protein